MSRRWVIPLLLLVWLLLVVVGSVALAGTDPRYCGAPTRSASGEIVRSAAAVSAFKREHPCPATGKSTGACPGWQVDHVIPLVCGGCDTLTNMQWLPTAIKAGAGTLPKDRWEQRVYCKA